MDARLAVADPFGEGLGARQVLQRELRGERLAHQLRLDAAAIRDALQGLVPWGVDDGQEGEQAVGGFLPGFQVYGTSPNAPFAITADPSRNLYAVQFHP